MTIVPTNSRVQVGIRLPSVLYAKLMDRVEKGHLSKTQVIIDALSLYLEASEAIPVEKRLSTLEQKVSRLEQGVNQGLEGN